MDPLVVSSNYFGSIPYYCALANKKTILVDTEERYEKQTQRSRTYILSANGPLHLSIPIKRPFGKDTRISQAEISYVENWQNDHWKAIESAYQQAPFFFYYGEIFKDLIYQKEISLLAYNKTINTSLLKLLDLEINMIYSTECPPIKGKDDPRVWLNQKEITIPFQPYFQVFSDKFSFRENLSIIDLIMNQGPLARKYLF